MFLQPQQGSEGPDVNAYSNDTLGVELPPDMVERLVALRRRYEESQDQFSTRELAHLDFLRWLYKAGRLAA